MTNYQSVKARVDAGVAYLTAHDGPEWVKAVNVAKLELSDPNSCVLGQVDGDYTKGIVKRGIQTSWQLGFDINDESYALLNRIWKATILKLQKARR